MQRKSKIQNINFILLLLFLATTISAQSNADTLRKIWEDEKEIDSIRFEAINKYYINHTHALPDSVLIPIDYHFNLAQEKGSISEMSNALIEKSFAYYIKGDTQKSREELEKSIYYVKQLNDPISLATVYSNLGSIYGTENKYQEAVRYFYETLKIFQENNAPYNEATTLFNIGIIYKDIDLYELALDHLFQSLELYREIGKKSKIGRSILNIGAVFYLQGKYEKALEKGKEALEFLIEDNNKFVQADCYFLLAKSYRKLKQEELAKYYVDKSLEIDQKIKNNSIIIERLTFLAKLSFDSNLNSATRKGEEVLKLIQKDTKNSLKANLYQLLYKCYKAQGRNNLSLQMHEDYVIHNDSVQIEKNNSGVIRDAIKMDFETKLHQNQLANEKTQSELKLSHSRRTYFIILTSIFLISLILYLTRKTVLENRKERELLLNELERLKTLSNTPIIIQPQKFELNRDKIEKSINRKINETDWAILNILLDNPVISNKEIGAKIFKSIDGVSSALRRMYGYFEIGESNYKKISLLMETVKLSNS